MNTPKVISAGHVCLDITPVFPDSTNAASVDELLVPGKLIHMDAANVSTGGSVANTGMAMKILGNDVALMGKVGNDAFGAMVQKLLAERGASGILVDENSTTSYSAVVAIPGIDRIFLHHPGANDTFKASDIPEDALEDVVLFHFGYPPLMKSMYEDAGDELASIFSRMKDEGIATSLDFAAIDPNSSAGKADWGLIVRKVAPFVDFMVPSFEELCFMLDREKYERLVGLGGDMMDHIDIEEDVKPLAAKLIELGCGAVLVKCGTAGMYFRSGSMEGVGARLNIDKALWADREAFQPCFKAEAVRSATGAGDTSIAAFLTAMLLGRDPLRCVAIAAAEGACCVTSYDALGGIKQIDQLESMIDAGWETI